jgi:hypothetical protein
MPFLALPMASMQHPRREYFACPYASGSHFSVSARGRVPDAVDATRGMSATRCAARGFVALDFAADASGVQGIFAKAIGAKLSNSPFSGESAFG